MDIVKKAVLFAACMALIGGTQAQDTNDLGQESGNSIPFPQGYFSEEAITERGGQQVVEAATMFPEFGLLNFDTSEVIAIDESIYEFSFIPTASDLLIEDRLKCMQGEVPMSYHAKVRGFIDYFSVRNRKHTLNIMKKKNIYFPLYEKVLKEMGMPDELKYLSIIESALNPQVRSRAGAVGLWQFMGPTGRMFGLSEDHYVDQRMDPEKSTVAACKYLQSLYDMFGDWELAMAAYNCGPGNIKRAQKRSGKEKFWDIYNHLPAETRSYLPQFVAMAYVLNYAEDHNLIEEQPFYAIPSATVYVENYLNLAAFAKELKICEADLAELNPELKRGAIPNGVSYALQIPKARLAFYEAHKDSILAASSQKGKETHVLGGKFAGQAAVGTGEKITHKVRNGETLGHIADKYGVSVSNLRSWNGIRGNMIRVGQKMQVYGKQYGSATALASASKTDSAKTDVIKTDLAKADVSKTEQIKKVPMPVTSFVSTPLPKGKTHVVQSGDSLWDIAQLYDGMTVSKLKKINNLYSSKLTVGQALRLQ